MKQKMVLLWVLLLMFGCRGYRPNSETETKRTELVAEQERFRAGEACQPDSLMSELVADFRAAGDEEYLCRALYVQGCMYNKICRYSDAMQVLKEAETLRETLGDDYATMGMIYMVQASAMEQNDYLWTAAGEKYEAALPYFRQAGDSLRMACCCRDIARMSLWREDTTRYEQYFAEAMRLGEGLSNRLIYTDIVMQYYLNHTPTDHAKQLETSRLLCDTFAFYRYADIVVEHYLECNMLDSVAQYLELLAADTLYAYISWERYHHLRSQWLRRSGATNVAYDELNNLYEHKRQRIYHEGLTRTYAIARMYDLEREQQKTLRLTISKQRLWLIIACIATALAICVILFLFEHNKRARQEQENRLTQMQLGEQRQNLQTILRQRVDLALRLSKSMDDMPKKMPNWARTYIEEQAFRNVSYQQDFIQQFNSVYGDLLPRLRKEHPALTDQDEQYLALAIIGMDNNEIAYLLGQTDRTIWNRRQKVKKRLGDAHMDLDKWLQQWCRI